MNSKQLYYNENYLPRLKEINADFINGRNDNNLDRTFKAIGDLGDIIQQILGDTQLSQETTNQGKILRKFDISFDPITYREPLTWTIFRIISFSYWEGQEHPLYLQISYWNGNREVPMILHWDEVSPNLWLHILMGLIILRFQDPTPIP